MSDPKTIALYDARAADYAKMNDADAPDEQLQAFLDAVPAGAPVLDLGCGPGRSAALMARAGHPVTALDAAEGMVQLAAQKPGVTAQLGTFDNIPDGPFGGIWANFSLLHADRAALPRHLTRIAKVMAPRGIFHIGMKTGEGTERDTLGRRYTYVTEPELTALLAEAGLQVSRRWTGRDKGFAGDLSDWVCFQATA